MKGGKRVKEGRKEGRTDEKAVDVVRGKVGEGAMGKEKPRGEERQEGRRRGARGRARKSGRTRKRGGREQNGEVRSRERERREGPGRTVPASELHRRPHPSENRRRTGKTRG